MPSLRAYGLAVSVVLSPPALTGETVRVLDPGSFKWVCKEQSLHGGRAGMIFDTNPASPTRRKRPECP